MNHGRQGVSFCGDTPAALHDQIVEKLDIDEETFMGLYSWYACPNVILSLLSGYLIDRYIGVRLGSVTLAGFVLIGHCIFSLGGSLRLMWLMDVGRFVFGIGAKTLTIVQGTYSVLWFKHRDLSLVFGLLISSMMIAEAINFNVLLQIYNAVDRTKSSGNSLGITLFIASIPCVISFACAVMLAYLDKRAEKLINRERNDGSPIHLADIKNYPLPFWILTIISLSVIVSVVTFAGLGVSYFENKLGVSPSTSHELNSFLYCLVVPLAPLLGFLVDVTGYHVYWILLAMVSSLLGLCLLTFTLLTPWIGTALVSFSIALWTCPLFAIVAFIVPLHKLSTAYGFMASFQSLGSAFMTKVSGIVVDSSGYFMLGIFFCIWSSGKYYYLLLTLQSGSFGIIGLFKFFNKL
ncbi:lysosomal dipeptide transporter MFSD1-like isoform X2 [Clavelina lepadiformis]|uniref:lysosomal dipeptide transporter MFSD1-like isoform X2 n=1 Tax=Clavelina lepadiformis TaxID=159417 RepID=UPI0040427E92